ncbi:hypothetical protein [Aquibacillus albus]|uniref:Uncharacterized protein n=1 Tax=Aquibacillus albus TaxID=1168171 RepID=A0ABS2N177_9BACI|nr:hypothetical protein [Aquibacillus albus]MBM7571886.1 hypothetical protein [Aquibacillus albus]
MITKKFVVIHNIQKPEHFYNAVEAAMSLGLPEGFSLPIQARTSDHKKAVVFWEGPSLEQVKELVEQVVGEFSKNEYYEMEVETPSAG